MKSSTTFQEASTKMRGWMRNLQTLRKDFSGPELDPLRLYMAIAELPVSLAKENLVFGQAY
eukprot:6402873-Amphidinium_carterae.1